MADPERLLTRAVLGTLTPREAAALRDTLAEMPGVLAELTGLVALDPGAAPLLEALTETDPLPELHAELARMLEAAPAPNLQDGGVIAAGVDAELDRYRSLARDSKRHILALEVRERERTGIASLKIRYNKVFGYYLEVTRANQERVPADYIRKQTLVNAERYVTPEIKELEEQILSAEERQVELEQQLLPRAGGEDRRRGPGPGGARRRPRHARRPGLVRRGGGPPPLRAPEDGGFRGAGHHPRRAPSGGGAGEPGRLRAQRRRARRRDAPRSCC